MFIPKVIKFRWNFILIAKIDGSGHSLVVIGFARDFKRHHSAGFRVFVSRLLFGQILPFYGKLNFKSNYLTTYPDRDDCVFQWVKVNIFVFAGDDRLQCKLHCDVGIDGSDALIHFESIQYESNVDVSTRKSI